MSDRQNAQRANIKARAKPRLTLPSHPSIEPIWASANGAAQASVVVMSARHGEARSPDTAFEPASS